MTNQRNLIMTTVLIIVIASSWMLIHFITQDKVTNDNNPYSLDSYITEANYYQYNKRGNLEQTLVTPYATHYPQQNITIFTNPKISINGNNKQQWLISAEHGRAENNFKLIKLNINVIVVRKKTTNTAQATLTTPSLIINPARQTATTKSPVEIRQPGVIIRGIGLISDLKKGTMDLLSQTQATFSPENNDN